MRIVILLGLLIASLASYNCVGMFQNELSFPDITESDCSDTEGTEVRTKKRKKSSVNSSLSLVKLFKKLPGFKQWFNNLPKRVRESMELYYDESNELNAVIEVGSFYNVFFNQSGRGSTLVGSVSITDEGDFKDIYSELIKYRYDEVAFHNEFRFNQIVLFTILVRECLEGNPKMSWQQLKGIIEGLKQNCSIDQLYSLLPNGKKSRMICYVLFRSPEQVRSAILLYQENNNLSDNKVKRIIKEKEAFQARCHKKKRRK